jgi:dimethylargininase
MALERKLTVMKPILIAITREVSPKIAECELTHLERQVIDVENARRQHRQYEDALVKMGCQVQRLPVEAELPDSVFVEDAAVVLDELAVITRPGAESRRPETESVARALEPYRKLAFIQPPGTLDGGDVLRVGKMIYVGRSGRSNLEGIAQMRALVQPFGYSVQAVEVSGCLHLKSAVTQVAEDMLLINPGWVDGGVFGEMKRVEVDPREAFAANALWMGEDVIYPAAFPHTRQRLLEAGLRVQVVVASELAKAEGGVTCCSLIFKTEPVSGVKSGETI